MDVCRRLFCVFVLFCFVFDSPASEPLCVRNSLSCECCMGNIAEKSRSSVLSLVCSWGQMCGLSLTNTVTRHELNAREAAEWVWQYGCGAPRGTEGVLQGHHWPQRWFLGSIQVQSLLFPIIPLLAHSPKLVLWYPQPSSGLSSITSAHLKSHPGPVSIAPDRPGKWKSTLHRAAVQIWVFLGNMFWHKHQVDFKALPWPRSSLLSPALCSRLQRQLDSYLHSFWW